MTKRITLSDDTPDVLRPGEVANIWNVNPKTVTRWANTGKIPFFRTPGGERRFHKSDIEDALNKFASAGGAGWDDDE